MAREFKKYDRGEFDSEIKVRKDGRFVLWEDVEPYIVEENGSVLNKQSTPKFVDTELDRFNAFVRAGNNPQSY